MAVGPKQIILLGSVNAAGVAAGVSDDESTSQPIDSAGYGIVTFYLRSIGTTSGGNLKIEEADWTPKEHVYEGTWSTIATIAASSFTGGAQVAYHVTNCAYGNLRLRVSDAITGGGSVFATARYQGGA